MVSIVTQSGIDFTGPTTTEFGLTSTGPEERLLCILGAYRVGSGGHGLAVTNLNVGGEDREALSTGSLTWPDDVAVDYALFELPENVDTMELSVTSALDAVATLRYYQLSATEFGPAGNAFETYNESDTTIPPQPHTPAAGWEAADLGLAFAIAVVDDPGTPTEPAGWSLSQDDGGAATWAYAIAWRAIATVGTQAQEDFAGASGANWATLVVAIYDLGHVVETLEAAVATSGPRHTSPGPTETSRPDPFAPDEFPLPPDPTALELPLPPWIPDGPYRSR